MVNSPQILNNHSSERVKGYKVLKVPVDVLLQVRIRYHASQQRRRSETMVAKKTNVEASASTTTGFLNIPPYKEKKGEEYMNAEQLKHFGAILLAWKEQLMQEVDSTVDHMKQEATIYADPVDRASQEEGFNLELRTRDRERKLLRKIEEALDRIDHGEYGYCTDCGTEIGIRRLEARPTAVKCIDCKTFEEIREKQTSV